MNNFKNDKLKDKIKKMISDVKEIELLNDEKNKSKYIWQLELIFSDANKTISPNLMIGKRESNNEAQTQIYTRLERLSGQLSETEFQYFDSEKNYINDLEESIQLIKESFEEENIECLNNLNHYEKTGIVKFYKKSGFNHSMLISKNGLAKIK